MSFPWTEQKTLDTAYFALMAGYLILAFILFNCLSFIILLLRCYVLTSYGFVKDLKKYGEWAVITGATDGIGKQYARMLAERGFNLVLIGNTQSALETVTKNIEEEFNVEIKIICFDFSEPDLSDYDDIEDKITGLDIGILINNVGMVENRYKRFIDTSICSLSDMLHTNVFSHVHMTHMVLKGMFERKRGAVVHVAAGAPVYIDSCQLAVYAATKLFIIKFVKALQVEYSGVIDHQVLVPFEVSKQSHKEKCSTAIPCAEDYVKKAIQTIGIVGYTHGCPTHEVIGFLLQSLPQFLISYFMNKAAKMRLSRTR